MSYQPPKAITVTNESCWHSRDMIPNPPLDVKHVIDEHYKELVVEQVHDTKVIMAHEFRENPEGFHSIAKDVVDAYNKENALKVFGEEEQDGVQD